MKDIREKLAAIFQGEHAEHLERIRSILVLLENVPEAQGKSELEEAFRRAHSLKGAARAVDLNTVEGLARGLETLFSRMREGGLRLDRKAARVIYQALESSEECVAAFREKRTPEDAAAALRAIDELLCIGAAAEEPGQGPRGVEGSPAEAPAESPAPLVVQPVEMVRLPGENLERLVRSTARILTESLRQKTVAEDLAALSRRIGAVDTECSRLRRASAAELSRLSRQPQFSTITRHIGFVEQQLRSLAGEVRTACLVQRRSAWSMRQSAEQLRRDVWSARMAPADDLFEGFRKMVRDLARQEKKEIEFRLNGSGVRADRMVLQALKDPVMHLLRNAISHGIEPPREREQKGKSPIGSLTLHIRSQMGRLAMEVDDDGRGVDFAAVASQAAKLGLSHQEPERVIFRPGFSTAPAVNDLSGRGMGLSVVYEAVHRLQGNVDLQRKEGPGASILLSVPLSASTVHLLVVSCQGQTFGVPSHGIERLYRVKAKQVDTVEGKPVVTLQGRAAALFRLAGVLGIGDGALSRAGDILPLMVLRSGARRAALLVDGFVEECDALIQDLGLPYGANGNVSGGAIRREGTVLVVLNPAGLAENCFQSTGAPLLHGTKLAAETIVHDILVVDDSITARSLEKSILEAHGYRVRVAADGVEALQLLRGGKTDLIVTDIQMPRLDGFGLLEQLKADPLLARIPVIVVSSLEKAEDQQRGLLLGADAYVVKRKFDQAELLEVIRQIL